MGRAKLPRKSTNIDMTAMCDVAFLLLSFFILTAQFKPDEALSVTTPSSVSNKIAPQKDVVMITIDKEGKVYLSVSDNNKAQKADMIDEINTSKNLGLTDAEKAMFSKKPSAFIGTPFSQLKSYLDKTPEQLKGVNLAGIPVLDSNNNEMVDWIHAAASAFQGTKMNILVKGDDAAKFPSFNAVIRALKKNDQMKFQMQTSPATVPVGSELYKTNLATGTKGGGS
ncbi:MAG: biopolymer transporter ExbD [Bacteroidetes bacterium]|nr:biopolymer transporter ExbD [Bacteroidota bacterium]MBS1932882.1 biopolymer transporter ExbD [Bacteroidota bacterium]